MRSWSTFKQPTNSWNNLQNKPAILFDNQISWDEILNKPIIESGTFAPRVTDDLNFVYTHTFQHGKYNKIGNFCYFNIRLEIKNVSKGLSTSFVKIANLPFIFLEFYPQWFFGTMTGLPNMGTIPMFASIPNTSDIGVYIQNLGGSYPLNTLKNSNLGAVGSFNNFLISGGAIVT